MDRFEIINHNLGHAASIIAASHETGLELALACALVEQESGGRNIFGCDHGDTGDWPPYCHQEVTPDRVKKLRNKGEYAHGMNGIGLTQLTWWEFVEQAEQLGGAHIPLNQCLIGFRLLKQYIDKYEYGEALGAYNAGEDNRHSVLATYAAQLGAKHSRWIELLSQAVEPEEEKWPTLYYGFDEQGWGVADGKFLRADGDGASIPQTTNKNGWLYVVKDGEAIVWPDDGNVEADPNGDWIARHPTRYSWGHLGRPDIERLVWEIVQKFPCSANTYHCHPERVMPDGTIDCWRDSNGETREKDSVDFWAPEGRGYPLALSTHRAILRYIFNDPNPPWIEWVISEGYIWIRDGYDWRPWDDDGTGGHFDHPHFTFMEL